jgi:hypothetical protein
MTPETFLKRGMLAVALFITVLPVSAGQLSLGFTYDGWNSNYTTQQTQLNTSYGSEYWMPFSLNLDLDKGVQVYGKGLFGSGSYAYTPDGIINTTVDLTHFADTVLGGEIHFKTFGLSSVFNASLSLPTGDSTWETQQIYAIIPTEFLDYRYRGRGFGLSALYGISLPVGKNALGLGAGYVYSGAFNPTGEPSDSLQLGDTLFFGLNYIQEGTGGYKEVARFSLFDTLTTQDKEEGVNFQLGTNLNASYKWVNPKGLSLEVGAQYFLPSSRLDDTNNLVVEADNFYAPRFYAVPSYAFGDLQWAAQVKYVLPNSYPDTFTSAGVNQMYFGGGWLLGTGPAWKMSLDDASSLNFFGSYDFILQYNASVDSTGTALANATYNYWTLGTNYQINF